MDETTDKPHRLEALIEYNIEQLNYDRVWKLSKLKALADSHGE